jgi:hypothetical protein
MKTKQLYKSQTGFVNYGCFELEIRVGADKLPDLDSDNILNAADSAAKLIQSAVMEEVIKNNPAAQERAANEKASIIALFPGQPFVEEIPNGYCSDFCCKHRPWFVVTTPVGRVKLGWRKRVILIDWSETRSTKTSNKLFAGEDVTKGDRMIHAWSYEKAKEYIDAILNSVDN